MAFEQDTAGRKSDQTPTRKSVAIVGTGITGLSAAWALQDVCDITVFEKEDRIGGHTNTVAVDSPEGTVPVDTGFIVYNEPNYPNLTALFDHLGVASQETRMHFSVSARERDLEYASHSIGGIFADLKNLARPSFYAMLKDVVRFHKDAQTLAKGDEHLTIGAFLKDNKYSQAFITDHLIPMAAAIWSCPADTILDFPAKSMARFFINHGLAELRVPFLWRTVVGGSNAYIAPLTAGFRDAIKLNAEVTGIHRDANQAIVTLANGERAAFDEVILACHGPQANALLSDPDAKEAEILGAFQAQPNRAVLHTDAALMPKRKRAWANWNYLSEQGDANDLSVTYWMNALQNLDAKQDYFVTLNPSEEPAPGSIIAEFNYQHPIFDADSLKAQYDIWTLQGHGHVWYAGAWLGYGFHEDGIQAGLAVAELISEWRRPWAFDFETERLTRPKQKAALPA